MIVYICYNMKILDKHSLFDFSQNLKEDKYAIPEYLKDSIVFDLKYVLAN